MKNNEETKMNQKKPLNESFAKLGKMLPPNMKQEKEKKQKENEEQKRTSTPKDKNEKK